MSFCPIEQLLKAFADAIRPPDDLTVSEWARRNFRTSSDYSAVVGEFEPHPYQVEPLDILSSSNPAEMMAMMCAAQMMKTLIALIFLGYIIDHDPGPTLIVQPTGDDAESFSEERISPMINDVPAVAAKMSRAAADAKSRSSGNKILRKRFRGGQVSLTGAISDSGLRRRSVRYLILDEIDAEGYANSKNGDRLARAFMRTATYWNRKIVLCSTPTVQGSSRIAAAYEKSDQRKFFVPCPFCGHKQVLIWANVKYGDVDGRFIEPSDAHYRCERCEKLIPHFRKMEMLRAGEWVAQNPDGAYPGFQISRLYAPDWSWGRVVVELFLPAKDDPSKRQQFDNEVLAETWNEVGDVPDAKRLYDRRESYPIGTVPRGGLLLTATVDVQNEWLAFELRAWGRNRESWSVYYEEIRVQRQGSDGKWVTCRTTEPEPWQRLADLLAHDWPVEGGGHTPIMVCGIDIGFNVDPVYSFCQNFPQPDHGPAGSVVRSYRTVLPIKGGHSSHKLIEGVSDTDAARKRAGLRIMTIGSPCAKQQVYDALRLEAPVDDQPYPAGYLHLPDYSFEYFQGITAEKRIVKAGGKIEWKREGRNEPLDLAGYQLAMATLCGVPKYTEAEWSELERRIEETRTPTQLPAGGTRQQRPVRFKMQI